MNKKTSYRNIPMIFGLIIFTALTVLTITSWETKPEELPAVNIAEPTLAAPALVGRLLPDDRNNYVTASLTEADIAKLAKAGVKTIVRLNGPSGHDAGHLDLVRETAVASRHGMTLMYFNIERDGPGKAEVIANYFLRGNTVVHCKHGAHRAPAIAAYYLRTRTKLPLKDIAAAVGWEVLPSLRYKKYVELGLGV